MIRAAEEGHRVIVVFATHGEHGEVPDDLGPDETLARVLDTARFAPNGGNAQSWHVVVVRDPHSRRRMAELYRRGWYDYVAGKRDAIPNAEVVQMIEEFAEAAQLLQQAGFSGVELGRKYPKQPKKLKALLDLSL